MTDEQLWRYYAYDYAWRAVFCGDHSAASSVDPEGKWFNNLMIAAAKAMLTAEFHMAPQ